MAQRELGACRVRQGQLEAGEQLLRSSYLTLAGDDPLRTRLRHETGDRVRALIERYEAGGRLEEGAELRTLLAETPERP